MDLIQAIIADIWQGLQEPFYYFADPTKRINYWYLISAILLAYYIYAKAKTNMPFFRYLFHKKVWFSKSAYVDYKYFFFNGIIKILIIVPIFNSWRYLGVNTNDFLEETFSLATISLSADNAVILYALSVILLYDLAFYIIHWCMHHIPFLWEFHKIHHSATKLNPITQYRLHPVELIINNLTYILVSGVMAGVFDYFSKESINLIVYAEANIFSMLFLFWGASLRHSHVKLGYFHFLENWLISPYQHQLHHSSNPIHHNKNMGSKFAVWDRIFGSLFRAREQRTLKFGLGGKEDTNYERFIHSLIIPFKNILFFRKKRS